MSDVDAFQNAKDTFYITLRDRLSALNADRTIVVRGATRPAVMVQENEMAAASRTDLANAFVLQWTEFAVDASEAMPLERGRCEIAFSTAGSAEVAGMDRGRVLSAMGEELWAILQPSATGKQSFAETPAVALATQVFWSDATFGPETAEADRVGRVVTVDVFAWKEAA